MDDQETNDREAAERENSERETAERKERRPTVIVTCAVPGGVQLRRHTPGLEDRAPMMPTGQGYELKGGGDTAGVDKEWFEGWLEENRAMSLVTSGQITWRDEEPPAEQEDQSPRMISNVDHQNDPDEDPINAGTGVQDGPANPARQPTAATLDPNDKKDEVRDPRVRDTDNFTDMTDTDRNANPTNRSPDADAHQDPGTVDLDKGDADKIDAANRSQANRPTAGV